ncbi:MAG: retroviral-like aspartic protease family protein [Chloroflexota bacterium]
MIPIDVPLLVDSGADCTVLSPTDAAALGAEVKMFPPGPITAGVGGKRYTRVIRAVLLLGEASIPIPLVVFEATEGAPSMPSILGRDVLSRFALVMEERTNRVLLLEPEEADRVNWP